MNHWLVKQEPEAYSWKDFASDGHATWDGVRNFQARNNLRAMQVGDPVLFYASGDTKAVVGLAHVSRTAFPDPSAEPGEGDWVAVELKPDAPLLEPVTLAAIKSDPQFAAMLLVRNSRLSVSPVGSAEYAAIVKRGGVAAASPPASHPVRAVHSTTKRKPTVR